MINYLQILSSASLIVLSLALVYVAYGAFQRFDEVKNTVVAIQQMQASVDKTLQDMKENLPQISEETSKGLIDGIRKGLNKE